MREHRARISSAHRTLRPSTGDKFGAVVVYPSNLLASHAPGGNLGRELTTFATDVLRKKSSAARLSGAMLNSSVAAPSGACASTQGVVSVPRRATRKYSCQCASRTEEGSEEHNGACCSSRTPLAHVCDLSSVTMPNLALARSCSPPLSVAEASPDGRRASPLLLSFAFGDERFKAQDSGLSDRHRAEVLLVQLCRKEATGVPNYA